jgi:hypothetical protein
LKRIIAKIQLPFTSLVICAILVLTGCSLFPPKTYNLSTSVAPSGGGTVSPSGGPFQGKVTLVATPTQNYQFIGWAGAASGNTNPLTVTMNSDKQIVAQFKRLQSTVQVTSNPSDGGTVRPASGTFDTGTTTVFTVTPNSGYRFLNWGGDASGNANPLNMSINTNKILTANFIKQYTLSISGDPNAGTISQSGGIFDAERTINLAATPVFPYAFSSWSGTDNNNVNPTMVTMNANKQITVNYIKEIAGKTINVDQKVNGAGNTSVEAIALNQFEWVQVELWGGGLWGSDFRAVIQDPSGGIVKDLGAILYVNYSFQAKIAGNYTIALTDTNALTAAEYILKYTIYHP